MEACKPPSCCASTAQPLLPETNQPVNLSTLLTLAHSYDRASMVPDADEDPYATPGGASGRALSSYERRRLEREQRRRRARSASSSTTPTTGGAYRRSRRGQSSYQDEEQVAEERARERRRQRGGSDGTSSRYD